MERLNKHQYYLEILQTVAKRATCDRGRSGAILVRHGLLISAGYVGSPPGQPHCDDEGHIFEYTKTPSRVDAINRNLMTGIVTLQPAEYARHCIRTIHAELNAILQAAKFGMSTNGSIMYCTMFPCYTCAKAMIQAGIAGVSSMYDYQKSDRSKRMFDLINIPWSIRKNTAGASVRI